MQGLTGGGFFIFAGVVVLQNSSVYDLKKAIERHVTLKQEREGRATIINWSVLIGSFVHFKYVI